MKSLFRLSKFFSGEFTSASCEKNSADYVKIPIKILIAF